MTHLRTFFVAVFVVLVVNLLSPAGEDFHYPTAKSGKGQLQVIAGVPILVVQGKPEEIGEQWGVLCLKPASGMVKLADGFVKDHGWGALYPMMLKVGSLIEPQFPPDYLKELDSAAKASGWPRDLLVFTNTIADLRKLGGCSALLVEGNRSATGGPLFGAIWTGLLSGRSTSISWWWSTARRRNWPSPLSIFRGCWGSYQESTRRVWRSLI